MSRSISPVGDARRAQSLSSVKKRLAFASPEISVTIFYATINSWYLYYLVNIAEVPSALAGLAFGLGRMFDAVIDPLIGRWIDTNKGGHGRKRIIKAALLPSVLAFLAIWIVPSVMEGPAAKTLCAALVFGAFALAYSLTNVSRLSMLPKYETDYHGRTAQIGVDMSLHFVALLAVIAGVPLMLTFIDNAGELSSTLAQSWWLVAGVLAIVACLGYLPFLLLVPDQFPRGSDDDAPLRLTSIFRVTDMPWTLMAFSFSVVGLTAVQSMLPFFLESYVGLSKESHAPILGTVLGVSLLCLPVWVAVGRRVGKRNGLMLGLATFMLFLSIAATIDAASGLTHRLLVAAVLAGASVAALSVFPWAMMPDAADRYFNATGRSGEGLSVSTFIFFNQASASCAVFLNGLFLSLGGHVGGQAQQSEYAVQTIYAAMIFVPMFFVLLCLFATMALRRPE